MDSDEGSSTPSDVQTDRRSIPRGTLRDTGIIPDTCIGDNMIQKGTKVTRAGALQADSAGGAPSILVEGLCSILEDLQLDIFGIGEARVAQ